MADSNSQQRQSAFGHAEVEILGRLTRKPELRGDDESSYHCFLSIAVNPFGTKRDGSPIDTEYYDVSVFGKQAANCAEYLDKGRVVLVKGWPNHRPIQVTIDGEERTRQLAGYRARQVIFIPDGSARNGNGSSAAAQSAVEAEPTPF